MYVQHSINMGLKELFTHIKKPIWPHQQRPFCLMRSYWWLQKERLIPPNQYTSFKTEDELSMIASVAESVHCQRLDYFPLWIKLLLSIYNFISCYVCLHLASLKILWFHCQHQNRSQRDLIHWATIQKTAWNSVGPWTAFTVAICKLLHTNNWGSHGLEARWQSCVLLAPE